MDILMISPNAPPKNSPESMQVGRYLKELDKRQRITLVTTPVERGWVKKDNSLDVSLRNTELLVLSLPLHGIVARLFASRLLKHISSPDKDFWIRTKAATIIKRLRQKPDVIYSRSLPVSAALLAMKIKKKLGVPWVMHLSDPWSDNPYSSFADKSKLLADYESSCFEMADGISVTTESLADFYRKKYPGLASKFFVSPNVMPGTTGKRAVDLPHHKKLSLVYTGALYGQRRPTVLLQALEQLRLSDRYAYDSIEVTFAGNIAEDIKQEINAFGLEHIILLGPRGYAEVLDIQERADVMISIEPDGADPLLKTFLPSKILDYIAAQKPVLAITPEQSESWKLCARGYGWAVAPGKIENLVGLLSELLALHEAKGLLYRQSGLELPAEYSAPVCAGRLIQLMEHCVKTYQTSSHCS